MKEDMSKMLENQIRDLKKVFYHAYWIPINNLNPNKLSASTVVGYDLYYNDKLFKRHSADYIQKRADTESPKFNIKIKKSDLLIIDEIAKSRGNTRAEVINYLLYQHLLSELKSVKVSEDDRENKKLQMLFASRADAMTQKTINPDATDTLYFDPKGWCGDLLGDVLLKIFTDFYEYGEMQKTSDAHMANPETSQNMTETYKKIYKKLIEHDEQFGEKI